MDAFVAWVVRTVSLAFGWVITAAGVRRIRGRAPSSTRIDRTAEPALLPSGEDWSIAARALRLTSGLHPSTSRPYVQGTLNGFQVRAQLLSGDGVMSDVDQVRIQVSPLSTRIELRPRDEVEALPLADALVVGDEAFDRVFQVKGIETFVRATLTAETRRRLLRLRGRVSLRGGELRYVPQQEPTAWQLRAYLTELTHLARELAVPLTMLDERLATNARQDTAPAARHYNLRAMARTSLDTELSRETLRAALNDEDASVRAVAAELSGGEGWDTLEALVHDRLLDPGLRIGALQLALSRLDPAKREDLVAAIATAYDVATAVAHCEAVERYNIVALRPSVVAYLAAQEEPVCVAAARAVAVVGDVSATDRLVELLARDDASNDVVVAVSEALGAVGSIDAVAALRIHAERWLVSGRVRTAASDAIGAIRSRVADADGGRLSLVDEGGGGLSLSADAGGVSLVDALRDEGREAGEASPAADPEHDV